MSWVPDATTRVLVLLMSVVGAALGTSLPASPGVGVAVLATALAALVVLALRQTCLAASAQPAAVVVADGPVPLLPGRVTDPVHHPLRPRAPGLD